MKLILDMQFSCRSSSVMQFPQVQHCAAPDHSHSEGCVADMVKGTQAQCCTGSEMHTSTVMLKSAQLANFELTINQYDFRRCWQCKQPGSKQMSPKPTSDWQHALTLHALAH